LESFIKDHLTLSERASKVIEASILDGSLKPGTRIIENEVAKKLGISKSPIREALKKLEGDGLVQLIPRKGYIVKKMDLKGIQDFFETLFIIEPMAAKLALRKKSGSTLEKVEGLLEQMKNSLKAGDFNSYLSLNDQFHTFFYEINENEWLNKIYQMLGKQKRILTALSLLSRDRISHSIQEHQSIWQAFKKGDGRFLKKAVKFHLVMFQKNILDSHIVS
jgi:DNA-binding GntR family transcriptional regulator